MPVCVDEGCPGVDPELGELLRLLPCVLGALRRVEPPIGELRDSFDHSSLGPRHGRVVTAVALAQEINVTALAVWLGLSRSATSLLVGELARAGILIREDDAADRRRTLVRLDPRYEPAARAWLGGWLAPWQSVMARLSASERAGFIAGWRALHDALCPHNGSM